MPNARKKLPKIPTKLPKNRFSSIFKAVSIYVLVGLAALVFFFSLSGGVPSDAQPVPITQITNDIKAHKIDHVVIQGDKVTATYNQSKQTVTADKEPNQLFDQTLKNAGIDPSTVPTEIKNTDTQQTIIALLGNLLFPAILLIGVFFLFRRAQEGAQGIFSFGQSKAKAYSKDQPQVKFSDIAGVDEAKRELSEIVEFLKTPEKFKALGARIPKGVLLVGPAGVGKCVKGDTLVWTSKGLLEIQDIPKYFAVEENGLVHGAKLSSFIPETVTSLTMDASHWYDLGISETIQLTTLMGFGIEGTPEHPLVVMDIDGRLKFRRLDQIKTSDWIPLKLNDQQFGNLKRLDSKSAYLLGLLTGDGGLTIKDQVFFSTGDKQLLKNFGQYFKDNYNYQIKKSTGKYDYVVHSAAIKSQLLQMGLSEGFARNKKIPDYIMMAPKEQVVSFLQGLFDTDGSVYKSGKVEYCTTSERLAKQVSELLLNMGIIHKFRIKGNNQYAKAYIILISGFALKEFHRQIGFQLIRKQEKLEQYLANIKLRTNIDLAPGQGKRIQRLWKYLVTSGKKPSLSISPSFHKDIIRYAKGERKPSMNSLRLFLAACQQIDPEIHINEDFQYLKSVAFSNIFFDQVKDLQYSQARVYDFTVPQTHSFIANGFISHNTLMARAVAGEAGVPFFSIAGSEFMEMLVGVGAARVRDMFGTAKKSSPSIIFIDEIESIGRMRGGGMMAGHDEREQTLNQILVEMDGFNPTDRVIVVGATNRPDLLDPALIRPGRFDRRVVMTLPELEERKAILSIHMKGKPFTSEVDVDRLARRTVGFSGADLANMVNEAAILAAREGKTAIDNQDLEEAATKEKMGPQRRTMKSESDRRLSAFHEAGHAIVGHFLSHVDPVHRISIIARGMSGGHTMFPPTEDRSNETKQRLIEQIATAMGGRAAEEVFLKDISTGAASDIDMATKIARAMVTEYGMSPLGPINLHTRSMFGWAGNPEDGATVSPDLQDKIDQEVRNILDAGYKSAIALVKREKVKLDKVAQALLDKETLDTAEFEKIVGKKVTAESQGKNGVVIQGSLGSPAKAVV